MRSGFLMKALEAFLLLPVLASTVAAQQDQRTVFAHFMHGLTAQYIEADWVKDIQGAKAVGIDAFALNVGPNDPWTEPQLDTAYAVAARNNFKLMISFDMGCCGYWDINKVVNYINKFKSSPAQYTVNGKPFVSTFEGTDWIDRWAEVRSRTGGIYFVPDWTSLGPNGFANHLNKVEGAFSWEAWPIGPNTKDLYSDTAWLNGIGPSKTYMAPVSPWFYTSLPQYNKNWLWKGDDLWFTRWEQMLTVLPDFIQIVTWNDFGESHYIGPITPKSIVQGANRYIDNMPHDGWRFVLPYYIAAYKAGGNRDVAIPREGINFWYRRTPAGICSAGGTTCNNPGWQQVFQPVQCVEDAVFVISLANQSSEVEVLIGGQSTGRTRVDRGAKFVKVPFGGRQGDVEVRLIRGSVVASARGASIMNQCPSTGIVNFNAVSYSS